MYLTKIIIFTYSNPSIRIISILYVDHYGIQFPLTINYPGKLEFINITVNLESKVSEVFSDEPLVSVIWYSPSLHRSCCAFSSR